MEKSAPTSEIFGVLIIEVRDKELCEDLKLGNEYGHPQNIGSERTIETNSYYVQSQSELRFIEKVLRLPDKTGSNRRAPSWKRRASLLDYSSRLGIA